jgi:hypothetical protein
VRFNALASVRSSSSLPCWTSSGWPRWRLIEPGLVATGLLASGIPDNVWDRGEDRGPGRLFTIVNNCHVDPGQAPPNLLSAAHKSSRPMAWKMPSRVSGQRSKPAEKGRDRGDMGVSNTTKKSLR